MELKTKLSKEWLLDGKSPIEEKFKELAKTLINDFQIKKGDNEFYRINTVEFYLFSYGHPDVTTYPRNCASGCWFFHPSGVDLSFESRIDENNPNDSFFGGILIRGIEPVKAESKPIYGPWKVCDELFDCFDAFDEPKNFPQLVSGSRSRRIEPNLFCRKGLKNKTTCVNYYSEHTFDFNLEEMLASYRGRAYQYSVASAQK